MGFETTNVAAQTDPQTGDGPLATIGNLANLQNAMNQNRMFQSNQVAGQLLQQSIDPATGQPDMNKFQALIAQTRGAAIVAPEMLSWSLAQTGAGIANTTNQQAQRSAQIDRLIGTAGAMQDAAPDQVRAAMRSLVQSGSVDQATLDSVAPEGDDGVIKLLQSRGALGAQGTAAEQKAAFGDVDAVDVGGAIQPFLSKVGPGGATMTPLGAPIQKTLSPSEIASPVNVVGPNGVETRHTLGEYVNPDGSSTGTAPVVANPEATSAASAVGSSMSGAANYVGQDGATRSISRAAFVNPDGSFKPNVKDADGNPVTDASGTLKVSLSPNDTAELATNATNQADRDTALETAYEGSPQRLALIKDMLATQGDFRSGPGAAKWAGIVTEANRVLGTKFDNTPASAEQVFGKIAEQLSAGQRSTLGLPATNAGTQAAQIASPNTTYSPEANQQVLAQLAGNERLLQAKTQAWDAYKKQPGATYNGFITQFNQKVDPRAFWEPYMTDQQRAAMMKAMNPNEAQTYQQRKGYTSRLMTKFGVDAN